MCINSDVDSVILSKMHKEGSNWKCTDCSYGSYKKNNVYEHVESRHVTHPGYYCEYCNKILKTKAFLKRHMSQCKQKLN